MTGLREILMVCVVRSAVFLVATMMLSPVAISAAEYETILVNPGQNVDIYWEINLSGKIFLAADIHGQPACLNYWWVTWPFGRNLELGRHCGRATFELPGLGSFAVGGKLRAGGADATTRI
jgi:hypothetical protein